MKALDTESRVSQFRTAAERGFRIANSDVAVLATITWRWSRRVTFPTGLKGFTGIMFVEAPGYKSREMLASWADGIGLSVR